MSRSEIREEQRIFLGLVPENGNGKIMELKPNDLNQFLKKFLKHFLFFHIFERIQFEVSK